MKIIQINTVYRMGSTGKIVADIKSVLEKNGDVAAVAYGRGEKLVDGLKTNTDFEFLCHALYARIFDRQGFFSNRSTIRLIKYIDACNPDIVHLHNIHGYYLNIKLLFAYLKRRNKPIVWTLHDCWPFTGHCAHFDYIGCLKWRSGCSHCPQIREYPKSILFDMSKRNYSDKKESFCNVKNLTLVVPSKWLSLIVKQSFLSDYPVHIINNGINLDVFQPTESDLRKLYKLEDSKVVLGVAAPWTSRKGLADIVNLAEMLPRNY